MKTPDFDEAPPFDIIKLREDIATGKRFLRITTHAQIEAFKDGLLLADLGYVFDQGEVIEIYPDEQRGLLYAVPPEINLPVHIVVEETPEEGIVVWLQPISLIEVNGLLTSNDVKLEGRNNDLFSVFRGNKKEWSGNPSISP